MWVKEGNPHLEYSCMATYFQRLLDTLLAVSFLGKDCGVSHGLQAQAHEEPNSIEVDGLTHQGNELPNLW